MVSLLDLAPSSRKVHGVSVTGISAEGLVSLVDRFPNLADVVTTGLAGDKTAMATTLARMAPTALKAIIAAGVGHPGDAGHEAAAAALPIEMQADFIEAIVEATLPSGFGPFVERIRKLGSAAESFSGGSTALPLNGPTVAPGEAGEDRYTRLRRLSKKSKRGESRKLGA